MAVSPDEDRQPSQLKELMKATSDCGSQLQSHLIKEDTITDSSDEGREAREVVDDVTSNRRQVMEKVEEKSSITVSSDE